MRRRAHGAYDEGRWEAAYRTFAVLRQGRRRAARIAWRCTDRPVLYARVQASDHSACRWNSLAAALPPVPFASTLEWQRPTTPMRPAAADAVPPTRGDDLSAQRTFDTRPPCTDIGGPRRPFRICPGRNPRRRRRAWPCAGRRPSVERRTTSAPLPLPHSAPPPRFRRSRTASTGRASRLTGTPGRWPARFTGHDRRRSSIAQLDLHRRAGGREPPQRRLLMADTARRRPRGARGVGNRRRYGE